MPTAKCFTQRRTELFTVHTRGEIVRALAALKEWKGTRRGVKVKLTLSAQPDFEGNRVSWSAKIAGDIYQGKAQNGYDALQAIQIEAGRKIN